MKARCRECLYQVLSPDGRKVVVAASESWGPKADRRDALGLADDLRPGAIRRKVYKQRAASPPTPARPLAAAAPPRLSPPPPTPLLSRRASSYSSPPVRALNAASIRSIGARLLRPLTQAPSCGSLRAAVKDSGLNLGCQDEHSHPVGGHVCRSPPFIFQYHTEGCLWGWGVASSP